MRHLNWVCAALALIGPWGCNQPRSTPRENPKWPYGDEIRPYDTTGPTPAYRELTQHTQISTMGRATHPTGAPNGKWYAYVSTETGPTPQIMMRAIDGKAPTQLTSNNSENLWPRISPDGKRIAFASNIGGNWDIYVICVNSPATWQQVTTSPNDDIAPSWNPEGTKLAYCTKTLAGYWQLVIVDVGSGIPTFLGPGMYPDWSPDGKRIAFQSQPRGQTKSSIWVVRPDGTDLREVAADRHKEWAAINPRWSPDGKWIAYATVNRTPEAKLYGSMDEADNLWVIEPDGQNDTQITRDLGGNWWPTWCGERLLFVSKRDGYQNIWSVKPLPLNE